MEKSLKLSFKQFGEHIVQFPNVGQSISIQSLKSALSDARYGDLARSGLKADEDALDKIDSMATFTILIPELKSKLPKTFPELDQFTAKDIVKTYLSQFLPWYNEIIEELKKYGNDSE